MAPLVPLGRAPVMRTARDPNPARSPRTGLITGLTTDLDYALAVAGTAFGAYHGYKRNNSIGWAIWWGFAGGAVPLFAIPIALAQGYGQRAGR